MKACVGTAAATSIGSSSCPWKEASRRAVGEAGRDGTAASLNPGGLDRKRGCGGRGESGSALGPK
jgi:hypothetical protein